ncbi:MAG: HEAT repeat domain-containing protein [Planctomycetota bacterium]|nr:HEAT repeat domain-containing protein [Planctomycetota bacterium]
MHKAVQSSRPVPVLRPLLKQGSEDIRLNAAKALAAIGPDAKAAISELLELMNKTDSPSEVGKALHALGRPRLQDLPLIVLLSKSDLDKTRVEALKVIACLGNDAKKSMSRVIQLLDDPSIKVRIEAIRVVGRIGPDAKSALPKLIALRETNDYETLKALEQSIRSLSHRGKSKNSVL